MTNTALARRGIVEKPKSQKDVDLEKNWKYTPFSDNVRKLIPTEYYSQVEKWHSVLRKPFSSCTTKDKEFVATFNLRSNFRPL